MNLTAFMTVIGYVRVLFAAYQSIASKVSAADVAALMGFVPAIISIVKSVEAANPGVPGATKLAQVENLVKLAYSAFPAIEAAFTDEWVHIEALISAVVDAGKQYGVITSLSA